MTPEQIRQLRQKKGLTQAQMADELGVHLRTYQQWEYGRRKPNAAVVKLLQIIAGTK